MTLSKLCGCALLTGMAGAAGAVLATRASAQVPGEITGQVIEREGSPLVGAEVALSGFTVTTMTDSSGRFRLVRVPPGAYQARVSRLSYRTVSVPVNVHAAEVVTLNVTLLR